MKSRLLLLIGAMQGWALWGLWKARELQTWPAVDPLSERALLYLALAMPLAFYLTHDITGLAARRRQWIIALIAVLFAALGAYSGWAEGINVDLSHGVWLSPPARPSDFLAAAVLGFALVPLLVHVQFNAMPRRVFLPQWRYEDLFQTAWRNGVLAVVAGGFTGAFWVVLFACSRLMESIGIKFFSELIHKAIFNIPVTGLVVSAAFMLGLERLDMIVTLRRFWLSITKWLLPVLMLFAVMWVVELPFTGVEPLFKTREASFVLLWFIALSVNFTNSAYQDGKITAPYAKWLGRFIAWAWLAMPVVACIAWWALWLRIRQHGWSEERIWGTFVLMLGAGYAVGYGYAGIHRDRQARWMHAVGITNTWVAVVMCLGLILLLSPMADARRLAVNDQMARLLHDDVKADKFDYTYLRWSAGVYGKAALERLANGIDHADREVLVSRSKQTLAQRTRYGNDSTLTQDEFAKRVRVLPEGTALDSGLADYLRSDQRDWQDRRCNTLNVQCTVWYVDLDGDGVNEAVVFSSETFDHPRVYRLENGHYRRAGSIQGVENGKTAPVIEAIASGNFVLKTPVWRDVEINGKPLQVISN